LTKGRLIDTLKPVQTSPLFQPFPMLEGRSGQAWRHQPAFRRPRHFHLEPEINLITRGSCVLGIGDRQLHLTQGQFVVFQPGQDHELIEASHDLGLFVLALRPELAKRALGTTKLPGIESSLVSASELSRFEAELSALGDLHDATSIDQRTADLFRLAIERAPQAPALSRRAVDSLRSDHSLSQSVLAQRLRATPSSVSREFRRAVGLPLVEYRARLRLMRFIDLVDSGAPFSRAATDADFGSYAQCHRVFRRALRCSPQEYFAGLRSELDDATALSP
jgi:AraC-like DNA-binding protein